MSIDPSTRSGALVTKAAGLMAGAAAIAAIALVSHATGHASIAKGALQGGTVTMAVIVVLWVAGPRLGLASRAANGVADERDDRILTAAFADSAFAMGAAAIGGLIGSHFGLPAAGVAGIVLWAGLLTFLVSAFLRARRM